MSITQPVSFSFSSFTSDVVCQQPHLSAILKHHGFRPRLSTIEAVAESCVAPCVGLSPNRRCVQSLTFVEPTLYPDELYSMLRSHLITPICASQLRNMRCAMTLKKNRVLSGAVHRVEARGTA